MQSIKIHLVTFFTVYSLLCVTATLAIGDYPICLPSDPSTVIDTEKSVQDIAYDSTGDKIYIAYWNDDVVDIFNTDGSRHGSIDLQYDTWGSLNSIDIHDNLLYGSMQNQIYVRSANLQTQTTSTVFGPSPGFANADIIVKHGPVIYIVNYAHNAVVMYNSSGQESKRFTTEGLRYPQDAAFDSDGNLHVVGTYNKTVYIFDANGTLLSTYPATQVLSKPFGIFIDNNDNNDNRFIADQEGNIIFVYDRDGSMIRTFFRSAMAPVDLVLVPPCNMWVIGGRSIYIY